jgi:hypothetical protein
MPDLVMQQEVDWQRRSLQQPGLEVRGHPRFPGEHGFQPQGRRVTRHGAPEFLAFLVRGLHRISE